MNIVIYIYRGLTALDCVGPYEVLSRLPGAKVQFVSEKKGEVTADTQFLRLVADYSIAEISSADILVVPGSSIGFLREVKKKRVLDWLRSIHETTQWTTSVCSGAILLAAAGLLDGRKASTHWAVLPLLEDYGAIPSSDRIVREGKIVTSQGVSAGMDMALYLAKEIVGEEKAKAYQLLLEYFPSPPVDCGSFGEADAETIQLARRILEKDAKKDLGVIDIARNAKALLKLKKRLD